MFNKHAKNGFNKAHSHTKPYRKNAFVYLFVCAVHTGGKSVCVFVCAVGECA